MVFDNPPSYDYATQNAGKAATPPSPIKCQPAPGNFVVHQQPPLILQSGPSYAPRGDIPIGHHYVNPLTGEHVVSALPPNHPEMICLQEGRHIKRTRFGLLGVLAAVFWFPLGIGLCLLDRRVRCDRCGQVFEDGILCG